MGLAAPVAFYGKLAGLLRVQPDLGLFRYRAAAPPPQARPVAAAPKAPTVRLHVMR